MKSIRLRCGTLAINSNYEEPFKSDWTLLDYQQHQIDCLLCQKISFNQIEHVLWNCQLYCGKIYNKIWRLEFRKHQRKCKICAKHILFRKLQRFDQIAMENIHELRNETIAYSKVLKPSRKSSHIKQIRDIILFGQLTAYNGDNLSYEYLLAIPDMFVEFLTHFEIKRINHETLYDTKFQFFPPDNKYVHELSFRLRAGVWNAFYYHFANIKRKEYNENIQIHELTKNCIEIIQSYSYLDSIEIMFLIIIFIKKNTWNLNEACRNFIAEIS